MVDMRLPNILAQKEREREKVTPNFQNLTTMNEKISDLQNTIKRKFEPSAFQI